LPNFELAQTLSVRDVGCKFENDGGTIMKKDIKLYNVLFPLWLLLFFPQMWLIVLPGNFIIDSTVLLLAITIIKIETRWEFFKTYILKVYMFGIFSDIIGAILLFCLVSSGVGRMGDELKITIPALILSSCFISIFNYFITFKNCEKKVRFVLSIIFAIVTAPYTFLVPSSWLYK
jgi:hypothetical protein